MLSQTAQATSLLICFFFIQPHCTSVFLIAGPIPTMTLPVASLPTLLLAFTFTLLIYAFKTLSKHISSQIIFGHTPSPLDDHPIAVCFEPSLVCFSSKGIHVGGEI